jgi:hypothetical protein
MKTLSDFEKLVAQIGYKPGWRITVSQTQGGGHYLQVVFEAVEAGMTTVGVQGCRKWFLSPHMTDGEVVQTALIAVLAAEEHEAREFFLYKGRPIFGPHFNLNRLVELCDQANATELRTPSGTARPVADSVKQPLQADAERRINATR